MRRPDPTVVEPGRRRAARPGPTPDRCDAPRTRRLILRTGLAAVGGVIASGRLCADDKPASALPVPREKLSQDAVHYQPMPKDARTYGPRCATCTFFQPPDVCAIVAGPVSSRGWCTAYALLHE